MIVTCPNCAHDFEKSSSTLDVKECTDEFEPLLTAPAKKVFKTKLTSCDFMTLFCPQCSTEEPLQLKEQVSLSKYGTLLTRHDVAEMWPEHASCDAIIKMRQVHFLSGFVSVSLAVSMAAGGDTQAVMQRLVDKRLRIIAHIMNTGVAEGWIKFGVLGGPHVLDMVVMNPSLRKMIVMYIGTDVPIDEKKIPVVAGRDHASQIRVEQQKWINDRLGAPLCLAEGELGTEVDWDKYAELHNIA